MTRAKRSGIQSQAASGIYDSDIIRGYHIQGGRMSLCLKLVGPINQLPQKGIQSQAGHDAPSHYKQKGFES